MLIHDAATAFVALIDAAIAWVEVLAAATTMVLCALPLCVAPGVKAARNALSARQTASDTPQAAREPQPAPDAPRRRTAVRVPSWAHTQPLNYEETA